jgi:precorrin-2 dehydrogenase/sirohydrochlorin ferrochelatase
MSPAMASILRKRVEKLITREDLLQIKLQGHLREASKKRLGDPASRREFVYRIINDEGIKELLRRDKYAEARRLAMKMLLSEAR